MAVTPVEQPSRVIAAAACKVPAARAGAGAAVVVDMRATLEGKWFGSQGH
ncbi:hypothetical protein GCM10010195_35060 [Kitasatospora griseola]|nr:hypothetical protein GCM10010195_35060 [Kitasatospora griseola]